MLTTNLSKKSNSEGRGIFGFGIPKPLKKRAKEDSLSFNSNKNSSKTEEPPLALRKKVEGQDIVPTYIKLQQIFLVKKNTYQKLTGFMSKRIKSFAEKIGTKNKKLSSILPYAREQIVNLRRAQDGEEALKIKLWGESLSSRRLAEKEPLFDQIFLSKRGKAISGNLRKNLEDCEINIENFRSECEKRFGWSGENTESLKNGKCMIEIITNIGEIQTKRIECERLLACTRMLDFGYQSEWDFEVRPELEHAKISEYLLRLSNLKLYEIIALLRIRLD